MIYRQLKLFKIFLSLTLMSSILTHTALAGNLTEFKTCDQVYTRKGWMWLPKGAGEWVAFLTIPLFGQVFGFFTLSDDVGTGKQSGMNPMKHRFRVARLLKSATLLGYIKQNPNHNISDEKLNNATETVTQFYDKYIRIPFGGTTNIVLDDVIKRLSILNIEGPSLGMCQHLFSRRKIAERYFAGGKLTIDAELKRLHEEKSHEAEQAKQEEISHLSDYDR